MNTAALHNAIHEAERFLKKAKKLELDILEEQDRASKYDSQDWRSWPRLLPTQSGEVRRASMDLTRQLAKLRRGEV